MDLPDLICPFPAQDFRCCFALFYRFKCQNFTFQFNLFCYIYPVYYCLRFFFLLRLSLLLLLVVVVTNFWFCTPTTLEPCHFWWVCHGCTGHITIIFVVRAYFSINIVIFVFVCFMVKKKPLQNKRYCQ